MKPGLMTTEFWMGIALLMCAAFLYSHGKDKMAEHIVLAVMLSYGVSRGAAKLGDGFANGKNGTPPTP
jgi:hypothetical protein